jgi:hypothetical protein
MTQMVACQGPKSGRPKWNRKTPWVSNDAVDVSCILNLNYNTDLHDWFHKELSKWHKQIDLKE